MLVGLFTELCKPGGIERVSQHIGAVLSDIANRRGQSCYFLSLNDPRGRHEFQVGHSSFTVQGFGRSKSLFVLSVLSLLPRTRMVYISHPNLAPIGLALTFLRRNARYIVATHGVETWKPLPLHRRLSLQLADTVTAPSQFTARKIAEAQNLKLSKIKVIPWALDPAFLKLKGPLALRKLPIPHGRLLLTVARLSSSEREKGLDTVIRTLPKILPIVPDVRYVIIGDGDDRPRLESLANDLRVSGHVFFTGKRDDDELADYYDACEIFVMPSRQEGFGVVFLEAMAFGKPIIGGNSGGIPEIVIDGVTGFLVEVDDIDTLSSRLITLLQDKELRERMGNNGKDYVKGNYTFDHFQDRLVQLLFELN